ncbi:hypothetical protein IscW_ISCW006042 [Ixodes scapularis]|uniref:Uncharacterized protein n=1 Tax=Ixodes scapularis TaxID=6945 RepID=B7PNS9_IXOSC|nr:hypothetical protein IscW_ISCW006042 [Ixodes scapularis]|eukprot:XP_002435421.1 hypothetical protein IscW_ISCW006042 [Ixodes scapularis]
MPNVAVVTANGAFPNGMYEGGFANLGSRDQCLHTDSAMGIKGRYCTLFWRPNTDYLLKVFPVTDQHDKLLDLSTSSSDSKRLRFLHGVKCLSVLWVVMAHAYYCIQPDAIADPRFPVDRLAGLHDVHGVLQLALEQHEIAVENRVRVVLAAAQGCLGAVPLLDHFKDFLGVAVLSYLLGYLLYLIAEAPAANIEKILLGGRKEGVEAKASAIRAPDVENGKIRADCVPNPESQSKL